MRQRTERRQDAAERTVKDIHRKTRKRYSAEGTVRVNRLKSSNAVS